MPVTRLQLLAWKAGALEPPDALIVEEALHAEPAVEGRMDALVLLEPPQEAPWRIPPPGLALPLTPGHAAVFDSGLRQGDRFQIRIGNVEHAEDRLLVVLTRNDEGWQVVFPLLPDELTPLVDLPVEENGERVLDLTAATGLGPQRWALALPTSDLPIHWEARGDGRWVDLMEGIRNGQVPIGSIEVVVVATDR